MSYYVLLCLTMSYYVLLCLTMSYYVLLCIPPCLPHWPIPAPPRGRTDFAAGLPSGTRGVNVLLGGLLSGRRGGTCGASRASWKVLESWWKLELSGFSWENLLETIGFSMETIGFSMVLVPDQRFLLQSFPWNQLEVNIKTSEEMAGLRWAAGSIASRISRNEDVTRYPKDGELEFNNIRLMEMGLP